MRLSSRVALAAFILGAAAFAQTAEELVAKNVKGARSVEDALQNLTRSIAATQLGITLTSIALGFVVVALRVCARERR